MVGVPGRSKACITCRKRRKGCDLGKPTCFQCEKAGLECEGYGTSRIFVVSTPRSRRAGYGVSGATHPSSCGWQRSRQNDTIANSHLLLARPEYERRCIDLFWEAYFPAGRPLPASIARSYTCTWTETARNLYREDDSLRYALWANCLFVTGRRQGTAWMLREGLRMYGKALTSLRKSLGVSHGVRRDASVATVKLLSLYESFSQQGEQIPDLHQDWQRHQAGELALYVARTPAAHTSGDAHYVFADERVDIALCALLSRTHLELSSPEWKSIPWQAIPKDLKDTLADVLIDMPGLVEHFDRMQACTNPRSRAILQSELLHKCWDCDSQLQQWLGVINQLSGPEHDPLSMPSLECSPENLVIRIAQVHGMSLYYTTGLVLYSILQQTARPHANLPSRVNPMHYARKLAEAVRILLQPNAGIYGQQSAALPLEVALRYTPGMLASSSRSEGEELLKELRRLREDWGGGLMGGLGTTSGTVG